MRRIQEVPVGGDHRWQRRPICNRTQKDALLGRQDVQQRHKQPYGAPRLHAMRAEGLQVSRKRVARLMRSCGLQAKGKRRWVRAADSHHTFPVCPGLLDRQFEVEQPNRVRASESTLQRHSNVTGGAYFRTYGCVLNRVAPAMLRHVLPSSPPSLRCEFRLCGRVGSSGIGVSHSRSGVC
ncbi:IS3 family transposase [Deinococcus hopiensis]